MKSAVEVAEIGRQVMAHLVILFDGTNFTPTRLQPNNTVRKQTLSPSRDHHEDILGAGDGQHVSQSATRGAFPCAKIEQQCVARKKVFVAVVAGREWFALKGIGGEKLWEPNKHSKSNMDALH